MTSNLQSSAVESWRCWRLQREQALPSANRDHALTGNYAGNRECHIQPDWLLIYRVERAELVLVLLRTGTHSDLM